MKAVRVHRFGLEHPMQIDEVEEPKLEAGEVLIQAHAIGVHPIDVSVRAAQHPRHKLVTLPYTPGVEAAGEIIEVGPGVDEFRKGQRVCGRALGEAYAERVRLAALWTLELPNLYTYAEGAGFAIQFITAWNALVIKARVSPGETVLVQGGGGGVGMASIQLARAMGCRVCAAVGSEAKADFCRNLGAGETINYREEDLAARCQELTAGRGVDVIVEVTAEANLAKDVDAIRPKGRIVVVGTAKALDSEASFGVQKALSKDAQIICISMQNLPPQLPELVRRLSLMLREGRFKVHVFREMPFAEANEAHDILWKGNYMGKLVLVP